MRYVIIGAGPAGVTAAETLRQHDPSSDIVMVGDEPEPPYGRMALPYLLSGAVDVQGTYLRADDHHFERLAIRQVQSQVRSVATADHAVTLRNGDELSYDRLLIATGSRPISPPIERRDRDGVHHCWTLADVRHIMHRAKPGAKVVLVGAGFIGCTILEALARRGVELTVVELEDCMVPRMMNRTGATLIRQWCEEQGVRIITSSKVTEIGSGRGTSDLRVRIDGGEDLPASVIVLATGVRPAIDFLKDSQVATERGVLADAELRSNVPDVFVAGDVAEGPNLLGGKRNVHAIQPTAVEHGRIAALNMTGRAVAYRGGLPMNVLDTLGLVSCSMGHHDGGAEGEECEAVDRGRRKYLRLVFDGERLVGALSVGHTEMLGAIRGLIQTRVALGPWKQRLLESPQRVAEALVARTVN